MGKIILGALVGLVLGIGLAYFLFVGVPRASVAPGAPILPPDPSAQQPGTAQIVLKQQFFNGVLDAIFRDMSAPTFPLTASGLPDDASSQCRSELTVLREGSGVQTAVRFDNSTLSAPMAFSGRYNSMFGCLQFTGWTQASMELRYDPATRSVLGRINVDTVNLDGVNPVFAGLVTPLVQSTINSRVNPIMLVDGRQISVGVPIAATNANLQASVTDVRAEIKENTLFLYVIYDFAGTPLQAQPDQRPPQ